MGYPPVHTFSHSKLIDILATDLSRRKLTPITWFTSAIERIAKTGFGGDHELAFQAVRSSAHAKAGYDVVARDLYYMQAAIDINLGA